MNRQEMESLMKDVYDFTKYFVGLQTAGSLLHPIGSALFLLKKCKKHLTNKRAKF